jgi:prepilin-type processing-associated H-X9-DG protein
MLMPSLMKAREQGISLSCTNNQKQIMLATMIYTGQYLCYPLEQWAGVTTQLGNGTGALGGTIRSLVRSKNIDGGGFVPVYRGINTGAEGARSRFSPMLACPSESIYNRTDFGMNTKSRPEPGKSALSVVSNAGHMNNIWISRPACDSIAIYSPGNNKDSNNNDLDKILTMYQGNSRVANNTAAGQPVKYETMPYPRQYVSWKPPFTNNTAGSTPVDRVESYPPVKVAWVKNAGKTWAFIEGGGGTVTETAWRHPNWSANFSYLDGHVSRLRWLDVGLNSDGDINNNGRLSLCDIRLTIDPNWSNWEKP